MWKWPVFIVLAFAVSQLSRANPVEQSSSETPTDNDGNAITTDNSTEEEVHEKSPSGPFPWEKSGYYEGDIRTPKNRNGVNNTDLQWPQGIMPYYIDSSFNAEERKVILSGIAEINSLGCVKIRPNKTGDPDYVWIKNDGTGCSSSLGRQKGQQVLNLKRNVGPNQGGCIYKGVVMHEFLHALGFEHQHVAPERDDYVRVLWNNIQQGKAHNFKKLTPGESTNFGVQYDLLSIMHYSGFAFGIDGKRTMEPKVANAKMGQDKILRESDKLKLQKMYGC